MMQEVGRYVIDMQVKSSISLTAVFAPPKLRKNAKFFGRDFRTARIGQIAHPLDPLRVNETRLGRGRYLGDLGTFPCRAVGRRLIILSTPLEMADRPQHIPNVATLDGDPPLWEQMIHAASRISIIVDAILTVDSTIFADEINVGM